MSDIPASGARNPGLDGLRGIAALSVALGHSVLQIGGMGVWFSRMHDFPRMNWNDIVLRLLSAVAPSDAAVIVFFVLSGHVLWSSFQRKQFRFFADLPDYISARLYRLFPLVIASGVLLGFVVPAQARDLVMNMLLLSSSLNGVLWSLQVEVVASLALFAVWGLTRGTGWKMMVALIVAFAASAVFRGSILVVFFPAFLLGAAIAFIPARLLRSGWVLVLGVCLLVLTNIVSGHGGPTRLFEMAGATVVVGAVAKGQLRFLRSRTALFLGAISYPFYLTHWFGLAMAHPVLDWLGLTWPFSRLILLAAISIGLTIPVAWLLHIGVENPALRARPRMRWWWVDREAAPAVASRTKR